MKSIFLAAILSLSSPFPYIGAAPVIVTPKETDALLPNPGMGWQTFGRFADEDKNLQGLPSASAYFRFYWREIDPKDGEIDFQKFDDLLTHARKAGQKLAFRIMCTGSGQYMDVPAWLKDKGCKGIEFNYGGRKHWVPDFTDPLFQQAHFRLIRELGKHYDDHPDMDLLDIGSVGLWGEWHMSSTQALDTGKPVPLPPLELRLRIIEEWCKAFPKTSKVILIGSEEGMRQAAQKGYGWRADCLGDMGGFSKNWNHMTNFYLQQIAKTGAEDAWRLAPVAFESCWDMRKWKDENWDIPYIFEYALRCHASYVNNKSAPIPDGTRPEIEKFLRQLGYRLVVRRLEHPASVQPGADLALKLRWENIGVAPPCRDYHPAIRLKAAGQTAVVPSTISIKSWLPGARDDELTFNAPKLKAGRYELGFGLVAPGNTSPEVRLANEGRDPDGWYPWSTLEVLAQ